MKETIKKLVNSYSVLNTFANLKYRWLDEAGYEDFNEYAKVMQKSVEKEIGQSINLIKGTQRPFGIMFELNGENLKLFMKSNNQGYWLACTKF
jgi:hypothetical protein